MQTKKAKYHLKRIETILSLHEDSLSRLDRDILLEDIRHLYDLVLNHEDTPVTKTPETPRDHTYVKPEPVIEEEINEAPRPTAQNTEPQMSTPEPKNPPKPVESAEPVEPIESLQPEKPVKPIKPMESVEPVKQPEPVEPDKVNESEETIQDTTIEETDDTPATVTYEKKSEDLHPGFNNGSGYKETSAAEKMNGISEGQTSNQPEPAEYQDVLVQESEDYPELFDFPTTSDLSDRLANTKIEHLKKILTINDKILFINHLFSGEAIPFQESLKKFESFYTYEEAKKYASEELVKTYNWTSDSKKDTIQQFMRQVKRLY